ncbi:MAG: hypothetical protein LPK45_02840, partial [Bacteroidota bacterium]|nr:hypothetical protein [Bacteroidota bacterium]MDX5429976.1 hypothetical protein [Bacteroidota bacterium]MDX5468749.1 hypothetical protein [Bacteroidota bacterium]
LASGILCFLGLYLLSLNYPDYWNPNTVDLKLWWHNIVSMRERLRHTFEGNYFLGDIHAIKNWTFNSWQVTKYLFLLSLVFAALQFRENRKHLEYWAFTLAAAIPFGVLLISNMFFNPRYLLPLPLFLFMWCALHWEKLRFPKFLKASATVAILVFYAGAWQLTQTDYHHKRSWDRLAKTEVAKKLVQDGYRYVFCNTPESHWQLMYYSGGKLVCTGIYPHDRRQEFPNAVREAYFAGEPVPAFGMDNQDYRGLGDYFEPYGDYWLLKKPSPDQLETMGYELRIMYD